MHPTDLATTGDRTPRPPGPWTEHDACGVGFVADIQGGRSHRTVQQAVQAVSRLGHRGAIAADRKTGDGAGGFSTIVRGGGKRFINLASCGCVYPAHRENIPSNSVIIPQISDITTPACVSRVPT